MRQNWSAEGKGKKESVRAREGHGPTRKETDATMMLAMRRGPSRRKHTHVQIHAARRQHTTNARTRRRVVLLCCGRRRAICCNSTIGRTRAQVAVGASGGGGGGGGVFDDAGRPPNAAHKVAVCVLDRLGAAALLREVPAADGLVVGRAQQVFAAGVEDESAHPVVVPDERLDKRAAPVPQLDGLVARPGRDELGGAARRRRLF